MDTILIFHLVLVHVCHLEQNSAKMITAKQMIIDFVAGCFGGVACVATGQPLDTVKIKIQTHSSIYKNSFTCFMNIAKKEGIRGLYAGTTPAIISNVMENSVLFLSYGQCQNFMAYLSNTEREKLSTVQNACAGSFTTIFTSLVLCPPELVKCRLQTAREMALLHGSERNLTMFSILKQIIQQDGVFGLYRGLTALFIRDFPSNFFFFGGYEGTKSLLVTPGDKDPAPWKLMLAGGVGGVSLWGSIYPIDVIKSKLQVWQGEGQIPSMIRIAQTMLKEEGLGAFYRGIWPTLIRAFPANGALFLAYEYSKKVMWQVTD